MDNDDYNAIEASDLFGNEEALSYGEENGHYDAPVCVVNELNDLDRRPLKRPLNIEDSDAIDWHMRVPCSLDEANDLLEKELNNERILTRLAERILQARKRKRLMGRAEAEHRDDVHFEASSTESVVLQLPPVDGSAWIGVSAPDFGQRYYLRLRKAPSISSNRQPIWTNSWNSSTRSRLNSRPISEIMEAARHELHCRTDEPSMEMEESVVSATSSMSQTQLWVVKYAPHSFVDLISDDRVNRLLLMWLKLWDECVFKRRVPDSVLSGGEQRDNVITLDNAKPRRPSQRVVLIAGAAGLGKTTLAAIVARHCGYRVVEMNASDDRNVSDFERKIEGAIRSVRTLDSDNRPNCLVVDEIDGAPTEAIKYLCKTVALSGRKSIRRPIICICNNLYVPSLRELRSIALVLQMPNTEPHRLERRLQQIANLEHIRIGAGAVAEIVRICGLDLRSSINALQFMAVDSASCVIDLDTVHKYGDRETRLGEKSLFDVWASVLEMGRHIDARGGLLDVPLRVQRVITLSQRFLSESERFHMGLFANYLSTASPSHRISSFSAAARAFCEYDYLNSVVLRSQNYALMKYMFVISVQLHLLLASLQRIQLTFPTADQNASQQRRQSVETILSVRGGATQHGIPERVLVLDVLPMLIIIVQPPLKPINAQLYSARELELIRSVVAVMRSYSLTFTTTYQDGVTSFIFSPPVDVLVLFPLEESERKRASFLSNAVRQMIAHQIDIDKLRSNEALSEKENGKTSEGHIGPTKSTLRSGHSGAVAMHELSERKRSGKACNEGRGIVYKYNQGFSNAIRRNIRMRNLLF